MLDDTAAREESHAEQPSTPPPAPRPAWLSFAATEQGPRSRNEDAFVHDPARGLFVVCDGMGRHAGGDVASRLAANTCAHALAAQEHRFGALLNEDTSLSRGLALNAMERAVTEACLEVYETARADPALRDMGTTLDAVVVRGRHAVIGHVGDGRVYLVRSGQVFALTEDHTLVAAQLRAGTITPEEAQNSPFRHVLARAVGPTQAVEVDTALVECVPGDVLLVCTDGLHGATDAQLPALLNGRVDASLVQRLVDAARASGTTDNATCIVIHLPAAPATETDRLVVGKVDALKAVPLFDQFTYREKQAVLACITSERRGRGEIILREGEPSTDLFVVVRGRAWVESRGTRIAVLEPGSHFGEMGLVDDTPRSATVRAAVDTDLLRLSRDDLWNLMRREPELGTKFSWALAQGLCERLRNSNESYALATTNGGYRVGT